MPASEMIPHAFFAEPHAATSQECKQRAAECLRLVRTSLDSTNKALLLEMAQAWIRLAEQQTVMAKRSECSSTTTSTAAIALAARVLVEL